VNAERMRQWADAVRGQERLTGISLRWTVGLNDFYSIVGLACEVSGLGEWRPVYSNNPGTQAYAVGGRWWAEMPPDVLDWYGLDWYGLDEHWLLMLRQKAAGFWDGRHYTPGELADIIEEKADEGAVGAAVLRR